MSHAKALKEKLDDALNLRFLDAVKANLRALNKDTGTAKLIENGLQITAEIPKKVTWDAMQMEQILKTISEEKKKAIVKVSYAIEERKYAQLSPADQKLFQPARTARKNAISDKHSGGPYARRKIFEKIGVQGTDRWVNMGKARIRAILESARNISPKDVSDAAIDARKISSFEALNGLDVVIKIGVERDKNGIYPDKNRILSIITPDHFAYSEFMNANAIPF